MTNKTTAVTIEDAVETVKATVLTFEAANVTVKATVMTVEAFAAGVSAVGGEEGGGPERITSIGCAAQEDSHK
jgi:hypothetical protein